MGKHSNSYTDECHEVMDELKRFEETYNSKVQEYELDKVKFDSTLNEVSKSVSNLERTAEDLSTALKNHMKDEEKHHLAVATSLATIKASLDAKPSHRDLAVTNQEVEKQKGRINTMWIIGSVVVLTALSIVSMTAIYVKNDLVETIETSSKVHYRQNADLAERGR